MELKFIIRSTVVFVLFTILLSCARTEKVQPLFDELTPSETHIDFTNPIEENDSLNVLDFTNMYTGSGVGVADFNKDGLQDLFFGANISSSRLYINRNDFQFEDVTIAANINTNRWVAGVSICDVNADSWPDVYLSITGPELSSVSRKNMLFVHQGMSEGVPIFEEQAAQYGLDVSAQVTHSLFLDFDKDGDEDVFMIVNPTDYDLTTIGNIRKPRVNGESASTDKLFRNNGDGTYTDISRQAGILYEGYSLGAGIGDFNQDGWPDIYVTNDFLTNDILYINQGGDSFVNTMKTALAHTSFASMGLDIADVNQDGWDDIFTLDMLPEDHYRYNMIVSGANEDRHRYMLQAGYAPQYSRNNLQLNLATDEFSEIGQYAGIDKTDWSWAALFGDYQNDGELDLYITNGFKRDMGDLDYINFVNNDSFGTPESRRQKHLKTIHNLPPAALTNYVFSKNADNTFIDRSAEWGITTPSCSTGAAYADLDNDGDLDLITNNVGEPVFIHKNNADVLFPENNSFIVELIKPSDISLIGTRVEVSTGTKTITRTYSPYRGYLSSVDPRLHFGLGASTSIEEVTIYWTDGSYQRVPNVQLGKILQVTKENTEVVPQEKTSTGTVLVQTSPNINYVHEEDIFSDYKSQSLLPRVHSKLGPAIEIIDIDQNGFDDLIVGASFGKQTQVFLQENDGNFKKISIANSEQFEDGDFLVDDFDNDGHLDLYVASGGVTNAVQKMSAYRDRLYSFRNGAFTENQTLVPVNNSSSSKTLLYDQNSNGEQSMLVFGRVSPQNYPSPPTSLVFEKQDEEYIKSNGELAQLIEKIGMVTDATAGDFDGDGRDDLIIAGEWMPITFIWNRESGFEKEELPNSEGWWYSMKAADMDNDGDLDILLGNHGLNHKYQITNQHPLKMYSPDIDGNGQVEPVIAYHQSGKEWPVTTRNVLVAQLPKLKKTFPNYKSFATSSIQEILTNDQQAEIPVYFGKEMRSLLLSNNGDGTFETQPLPEAVQYAPVKNILVRDINSDQYPDVILTGNSFCNELLSGPLDASRGSILIGNKTGFSYVAPTNSGLSIKLETTGQGIMKINGVETLVVAQNSGELLFYQFNSDEI